MTTLFSGTITAAGTVTGTSFRLARRNGYRGLAMQANFTYGSGGTSLDVKVQTSLDGGTTWIDIWHATQFLLANSRRAAGVQMAASSADFDATVALTSGQTRDGILGDLFRVTYTSVGTYATSTTLQVDAVGDQLTNTTGT